MATLSVRKRSCTCQSWDHESTAGAQFFQSCDSTRWSQPLGYWSQLVPKKKDQFCQMLHDFYTTTIDVASTRRKKSVPPSYWGLLRPARKIAQWPHGWRVNQETQPGGTTLYMYIYNTTTTNNNNNINIVLSWHYIYSIMILYYT